jgi:hypothetical protein
MESAPKITAAELENKKSRLATAVAPMLLTIVVFALNIMINGWRVDPQLTHTNEILALIAAVSILTAAFLIDFNLDGRGLRLGDRLLMFKGGYVLFCVVVAVNDRCCAKPLF